MYRHEPESPLFRVSVAMRPGGRRFGTMPAHEGMNLAYGGTVVRVNERSIIVRNGQQETHRCGAGASRVDGQARRNHGRRKGRAARGGEGIMIRSITYGVGGNSARLELSTGLVLVVAGPRRHEVFASLDEACEALGDDAREINVQRFDVEGRYDGLCTPTDERDVIVYELRRLGATVETDDGSPSLLTVNGVQQRWYGVASAFNVHPLLLAA